MSEYLATPPPKAGFGDGDWVAAGGQIGRVLQLGGGKAQIEVHSDGSKLWRPLAEVTPLFKGGEPKPIAEEGDFVMLGDKSVGRVTQVADGRLQVTVGSKAVWRPLRDVTVQRAVKARRGSAGSLRAEAQATPPGIPLVAPTPSTNSPGVAAATVKPETPARAIFVNGASNASEEAAIRGRAESAPAPSAVLRSGAPAWAVPRCLQRCVMPAPALSA